MKRIYIILITIFTIVLNMTSTQARQSRVSKLPPMIGAHAGFGYNRSKSKTSILTIQDSYKSVCIGVFLDMKYFRAGVDYYRSFGDLKSEGVLGEASFNDDSEISISYTNFFAFGKYPSAISRKLKIWPLAGAEFAYNKTYEVNGNTSDADELNDLFILAGFGGDYAIDTKLVCTVTFIFSYNLTPDKDGNDTGDSTQFKLDCKAGIGYRI